MNRITKSLGWLTVIGLCLLIPFYGGCGSSSEWTPGDEERIRELVANMSDARSSTDKLQTFFTHGATPDKLWLAETNDKSFVVESVEVVGETAHLTIEIENHFGELLGSTTWKCQKTDDAWKLVATPLP